MVHPPILGIQMSPISLLHEGADHVCKLLADEAGLNALFVYCNTYQISGWDRHRHDKLADDHGVAPPDFDYCDTRNTWFDPDPKYYQQTPFLSSDDEGKRYTDRDVFSETFEAAERHGFQVFARALEAESGHRVIPGWSQISTIDCFGQTTNRPCPNHPDYQSFWVAIMEDLFHQYPNLAGFKLGAERPGPLSLAMFNGPGFWYSHMAPDCFCGHCQDRLTQRGIDVEKARTGYQELVKYSRALHHEVADTRDGAMVGAFRLLIHYPEVLAHHREFLMSLEELHARLAGVVRSIRPDALFGLHIYQGATSWDVAHRATIDYRKMGEYVDFLKPVIYQKVAGQRMIQYLNSVSQGALSDFGPEGALQLLYQLQGFDGPPLAQLGEEGFSIDYVYRETRRCVEGLAGKALTLAGPGFNIGGKHSSDTPDFVYETINACFEAGADGLIVSREYDEMRRSNLQAVGRAVRKHH